MKFNYRNPTINTYMFFSVKEYKSWHEALSQCTGYDSPIILEKIYQAALKVKKSEAAYERDSVLFENIQYSWPVLSALMCIAALNNGQLNIIDFGGSLGTSYFQNRKFLNILKKFRWNIIEQAHFVKLGKREFENENLKFYFDFDTCMQENDVHAIFFSGVLQYLENPFAILEKVKSSSIKFIIIDRTSFHTADHDKIVLQKAPRSVFKASYPSWIFSQNKFELFFKNDVILESFESFKEKLTNYTMFKGYIIQLNHGEIHVL